MRKKYKRKKAPNLRLAKINLSHHEQKVRRDNGLVVERIERLTIGKRVTRRIRKG